MHIPRLPANQITTNEQSEWACLHQGGPNRTLMRRPFDARDGEDHRSLILISKIFANDLDLLCDLDSWQWSLIFDLDLAWFDLDIKITNLPNLDVGIFQYVMYHTPDTFKRN